MAKKSDYTDRVYSYIELRKAADRKGILLRSVLIAETVTMIEFDISRLTKGERLIRINQ